MSAAQIFAALAVVAFLGGVKLGAMWEEGRAAVELRAAQRGLQELATKADRIALQHADEVTKLNRQLGGTRAKLYALTDGRECLSGDVVRMLNDIAVPGAASEPARAPEAAATDRDVSSALAVCRSEYARIADQLNRILDIEDMRH